MHARTSLATLAVVTAFGAATAAAATARADLPGPLAVGTPAELTVTVDGNDARPPSIKLDGADVRYAGQSSQTTIVNGASSSQVTFMYRVVPSRTGDLVIPTIAVATDAGTATTAPIHATVAAAGTTPAQTSARPAVAMASDSGAHAFIRIELPSKALYVGQAVPVKIRAYFRAGVSASLQASPHLDSDAFTFSDLSDKPVQTQVEVGGVPYLQATWTAILSPAKPSDGKLAVILPVELAYRDAPRPRTAPTHAADPFGAFFGDVDPFGGADPLADMDSFFDLGAVQQHQVTLQSSAGRIVVSDLPAAGKPPGFGGAVGRFQLAADPPAGELRVGEPATIAIRATGTGNFDRVALSGVAATPELDSYAGKTTFTPGATGSLSGTKTLVQTIVPRRAGALSIPEVSLVYFDPVKRAYVTTRTAPLAVTVAAAAPGSTVDPGLATVAAAAPAVAPHERGRIHHTLEPRIRQRGFRLLFAAIAAITALVVGLAWWRRDPRLAEILGGRRLARLIAARKAAMDRAARDADPAAFFRSAREALQARLGARWHVLPDAITAADVDARLGPSGATIRSVFEHADRATYAGRDVGADPALASSLGSWRARVADELARLEVSP